MIGGARMFSVGASMDIGARNAEAVRTALKQAGIRINTEEVGGNRGRTARIILGSDVSSQLAGGERTSLMALGTNQQVRCEGRLMNDILNPDQIAALFEAAKSGNVPEASSSSNRRQQRMRSVDFSRPTKFTADHQRRITRATDGFCLGAGARLTAELRSPVEFETLNTSQVTLGRRPDAAPVPLADRHADGRTAGEHARCWRSSPSLC